MEIELKGEITERDIVKAVSKYGYDIKLILKREKLKINFDIDKLNGVIYNVPFVLI